MTFGEMIENYRKQYGWSQYELARMSGVSRTTIKDIEKGRHTPSLTTIDKLAQALEFYTEWDAEEK